MRGLFALIMIVGAIITPTIAGAQEAGAIAGQVVDAETHAPLSGVSVLVQGGVMGAITGEDGTYRIGDVPPGSYLLVFRILGYGTVTRPDVLVAPGRSTEANAELPISAVELEGIVVDAGFFQKSESQPASTFALNAEEIRREPGSAGDISRVLLALPSTAQVMDNANDLFVRGGSPFENGFFIDNIQVGNINHFPVQGSTGGPIGMVNLEFVDNVSFSAGGFSAAHGDRLSSIVDIEFREGSREDLEMGAEVSMVAVEGFAEGPLPGAKGSWLFSARKSYLDLVVDAIGTGVAPRYGDLQGKVTYDLDGSNRISALALMGESRIGFDEEQARDQGDNAFGDYASRQGTIGLSWRRLWGDQGYSVVTVSASAEAADDDWYWTATADSMAQSEYVEAAFRVRNLNRLRLNSISTLELGGDFEAARSDYDYVLGEYHDRLGTLIPRFEVDQEYEDNRAGAFANLTFRATPRWDVTLGGRMDHYSASGTTNYSPRISSSLSLGDRVTLNAAAGSYRQRLPGFILSQNPAFQDLPVPEAVHVVMGADYLLSPSTQLTVEGYWKEYDGLPLEEEDPSLFVMDEGISGSRFRGYRTLVGSGKARSYGLEMLLQKKLTDRFYGLASASLFKSRYRGLDQVWRNRAHDNRYLFNVVGGYRPSHKWELSGRWSIAGGAPYTPFDVPASTSLNSGVIDQTRVNGARYPTYHSLNLRVARRDVFKGSVLTSYLALWNAYGRENVSDYYWNQVDNERGTYNQWGFLPVFGVEWKF